MHLNYANNIAVVSEHIASAPALWIFKKKTMFIYPQPLRELPIQIISIPV